MIHRRQSASINVPTNYAPLALLGVVDQPWMARALCAETDPEEFFPEKGGSTRAAKTVCGRCIVRAECLIYALDNGERYGIWGGLSERDRRALRQVPDPVEPVALPEEEVA